MPAIVFYFIRISITVLVDLFIIFDFYHRTGERVYQSKALYVGSFLLGAVLITSIQLFENPFVNIVIYSLFIFSVGVLLYGTTKVSEILSIILLILFLMLTEIVGQFVVSLLFTASFSISAGNLVQSIITFFSFQVAMHFVERKEVVSFHVPVNWITLLIIPGISIFLIAAILNLLTAQSTYTQVATATISCMLVFVINIIVYFLFNRIAALHIQKEQYGIMEQQRQMQYRYFSELEQKYESSRKLFHDIKNHINTLERMYALEVTKTNTYTQALREHLNDAELPTGGNRVLNILLNDRMGLAKANGISFETACEDIDISFISDFDLTTIIGNLLDNAFDECMANNLYSKTIRVRIYQINCFIMLIISNTCEKPPLRKGKRYISQKDGHAGLGLLNVQETVERYGARLNQTYTTGLFKVQITFPGQEINL